MRHLNRLLPLLTMLLLPVGVWGQQNVYHRSESTSSLWWDSAKPWYYLTWNSTEERPDIWPVGTRNHVFIGHNNQLSMSVNGATFQLLSLTFESGATSNRTLTTTESGRLNVSSHVRNQSTGTHTLNVSVDLAGDVSFDAANAAGTLVLQRNILLGTHTAIFTGAGTIRHDATTGIISGTGGLTKSGLGTAVLNGNHTYTGATAVDEGTLRIGGTFASSGFTVKSGATLEVNAASIINNLTVEAGGTLRLMGTGKLTVLGTLVVQEYATAILSTQIGGDLELQGDATIDGTLTHNNRAIFFRGGEDQVFGRTAAGSIDIPYVLVDKSEQADVVNLSNTTLRIAKRLTLTKGTLGGSGSSVVFLSDATGSAMVANTGEGTLTLPVTVERHIARTDDPASSFVLLGSPLATTLHGESGSLLDAVWTQATTGGDGIGAPNVFRFDESSGMNGWVGVQDLTEAVARGTGYLVGIYKDDDYGTPDGSWPKTLRVTGTWNSSENDGSPVSLPVTYTESAGAADTLRGWNLVANPFIGQLDWNAAAGWTRTGISPTYQVLTQTGAYQGYNHSTDAGFNGGTNLIQSFQGFWVKAVAASPVLTVADSAKVESQAAAFHREAPVPAIWLEIADGTRRAGTTLTFRADGALGSDLNDALHRQAESAAAMTFATGAVEGQGTFSIQHLPIDAGLLEIPLHPSNTDRDLLFRVASTRALPGQWSLYLKDDRGSVVGLEEGQDRILTASRRYTLIIDPLSSTAVDDPASRQPLAVRLDPAYPNPFNPSTVVSYQLPVFGKTRLAVYDLLGREVAVLVDGMMPAGAHTVTFDAAGLSSGIYLLRLQSAGQMRTQRITLVK